MFNDPEKALYFYLWKLVYSVQRGQTGHPQLQISLIDKSGGYGVALFEIKEGDRLAQADYSERRSKILTSFEHLRKPLVRYPQTKGAVQNVTSEKMAIELTKEHWAAICRYLREITPGAAWKDKPGNSTTTISPVAISDLSPEEHERRVLDTLEKVKKKLPLPENEKVPVAAELAVHFRALIDLTKGNLKGKIDPDTGQVKIETVAVHEGADAILKKIIGAMERIQATHDRTPTSTGFLMRFTDPDRTRQVLGAFEGALNASGHTMNSRVELMGKRYAGGPAGKLRTGGAKGRHY